jgi:low density lipoprotein receptor-related protein 5/6
VRALMMVALAVTLAGCPSGMPKVDDTPTPPLDKIPTFGTATLPAQSYRVTFAIDSVSLPAAMNGDGDLIYALTPLPDGLLFDATTRVLSGTPTTADRTELTYTVKDVDGDVATLGFSITVHDRRLFWTEFEGRKIQSAAFDGTSSKPIVTDSADSADGLLEPHHLAVDVAGTKIYWTDYGTWKIQRANLDGSDVEDVVSGEDMESYPRGIALDVTAGRIYWTEDDTKKIRYSNLDGSGITDLLIGESQIYEIALDLSGKKVYWTEDGTTDGKIRCANLDGTGITDLITNLTRPRGIALDVAGKRVYWTDDEENGAEAIRRANLDGSDQESLVSTQVSDPTAIGLDVKNGKMYWVDIGLSQVSRADLDGSDVEVLAMDLGEPYGIALY